jgi:hypothetical protein
LVGESEIDADADVLERREGEVEVEVRMGTGEGGMEECRKCRGETPEEERHRPRIQARQEGPHLRIEAGRIVQRDDEE